MVVGIFGNCFLSMCTTYPRIMNYMSKLLDAAVKLYHKRHRNHISNMFDAMKSGDYSVMSANFKDADFSALWKWACKRWPSTFSVRECELRDQHDEEMDNVKKHDRVSDQAGTTQSNQD